ncbi:hypothetical protein [Methylosinus sp. Sm6]|uniref:hypothetical protein n=1 Tax=Methylosinus sp. Sm6 TaxID=2866948 RepID=UPI001C98F7D6|nr:hypothetical protein [Methylosinus sp. Sm6]MBY6240594.1 hypothetical protein [Methylosinus sp. Sm6]
MVSHRRQEAKAAVALLRGALTPSDAALDGKRSALLGCVERLIRLIEQETIALRGREAIDFDEFNARKAHALLEFSRAWRAFGAPASAPSVESALTRLRARLAENAELLNDRLRAMREIAGIMIYTIEMAESDGTYTMRVKPNR